MTDSERKERAARFLSPAARPVWLGDDGWLRVGRTDDLIQMLSDLGIRSCAA